MANPVKIVKGIAKTKKTFTKGKDKAVMRESRAYDSNTEGLGLTKGKNKNWAKDTNKKTLLSAAKSRRASVKESSFNTRMQKHPLVRNAGNASSETKYRVMRGKPVPVKKRGK